MRRIFSPRNIVLLLAALGVAGYYGSFVWTDYLWFASQGYGSVFTTTILSRLAVGLAAGALTFVFLLANLALARRDGPPRPLDYVLSGEVEIPFHLTPGLVTALTYLIPLVLGVLVGSAAAGGWMTVRQYLAAESFGIPDPFFARDVGFYVFSLPLFSWVYRGAMTVLVLALILTALHYLANGGIDFPRGRPVFSRRAWRHLSLLGAGLLVGKAAGYLIAQFNLLYSPRGVAFGASYTDVHAQLPALRILMLLALVLAAVIAANGWLRRRNYVTWGLVGLAVVSIVLGTAYPAFVQQFTVEPDEINKETPYMEHNIAFTRAAYDLDRVEERVFTVGDNLTGAEIQAERATIDNIRLWDWQPLRESYGQLQAIRPYYDFADVDLDRYVINGRYRQVMLAARELNLDQLPQQARTWLNLHLKYTHGYGVVMSPTTEATSEGMPTFFLQDIPPQSTVEGLEITRPQIYFGELTNDYAIVRTRDLEFDYPLGDENRYNSYDGQGGVVLANPLIRAAFALRLGSYQTLLAESITEESRVLLYRNIHQLVRKIAPFFVYDRDPYLVVGDDGRLFYIQDAYTVTNRYPYSEPRGGINYIRNSVKIAIDAYHGTVTFYLWDPADPIASSIERIFPGLLQPASAMPADMLAHVRYPQDLFTVQAEMYAVYHMQDPMVFYNREDVWERPAQLYGGADRPPAPGAFQGSPLVEPHYMIIRLPGEETAELVQMLPFSPREKNNMIAWMAARSDGEKYGELVVFKFPKQELIYGPRQIEARIDQDTVISQNLTLWSQAGSNVIRGTLLVIPVRDSLLYVEPLYLQAEGNRLPELKRVIVSYGDQVVMAETLDGALRTIFGGGEGGVRPGDGTAPGDGGAGGDTDQAESVAELAQQANRLYDLATEASTRGDWAAYGDYLDELERVLERLEQAARRAGGE